MGRFRSLRNHKSLWYWCQIWNVAEWVAAQIHLSWSECRCERRDLSSTPGCRSQGGSFSTMDPGVENLNGQQRSKKVDLPYTQISHLSDCPPFFWKASQRTLLPACRSSGTPKALCDASSRSMWICRMHMLKGNGCVQPVPRNGNCTCDRTVMFSLPYPSSWCTYEILKADPKHTLVDCG